MTGLESDWSLCMQERIQVNPLSQLGSWKDLNKIIRDLEVTWTDTETRLWFHSRYLLSCHSQTDKGKMDYQRRLPDIFTTIRIIYFNFTSLHSMLVWQRADRCQVRPSGWISVCHPSRQMALWKTFKTLYFQTKRRRKTIWKPSPKISMIWQDRKPKKTMDSIHQFMFNKVMWKIIFIFAIKETFMMLQTGIKTLPIQQSSLLHF